MDVVKQDTRKGEERRRGCRGQDEMIGCGEPFREHLKEEERSFLKKNTHKNFQIYFLLYITRVYFKAKYVRLHLKVKLHYAHISSLICLVFIDLLVKAPVAGYLGFQLVNITSVSPRCHLHKGIQLSSYTDILYQASFSHPSYPPVYA